MTKEILDMTFPRAVQQMTTEVCDIIRSLKLLEPADLEEEALAYLAEVSECLRQMAETADADAPDLAHAMRLAADFLDDWRGAATGPRLATTDEEAAQ